MDKYLQPYSAFERLRAEYKKHGSLIVAVDFDDTLYDFHKSGATYYRVIELVRELKKIGCYIIIWTGNEDTSFIRRYCDKEGIYYDSINEDAPYIKNTARKVYANVYIDDRAGLSQVYSDLTRLVNEVKYKDETI